MSYTLDENEPPLFATVEQWKRRVADLEGKLAANPEDKGLQLSLEYAREVLARKKARAA